MIAMKIQNKRKRMDLDHDGAPRDFQRMVDGKSSMFNLALTL